MVSGIVELISKVGVSIALSTVFGYIGIGFASPLGWVIGPGISAGYCYFGKWKKKALEAEACAAAKA